MHVIEKYRDYFRAVSQFRQAPHWQKELLARGTLLTLCDQIEPASVRPRLRKFWAQEAAKLGMNPDKLKTWA